MLYRDKGAGQLGRVKGLMRWPLRHGERRDRKTYRKTVDPTKREQEVFTGMVQGKKASDAEERFYNMLNEVPSVDVIRFRTTYDGMSRISFDTIELDFLFRAGGQWFAVQLDEEYFHSGAQARARDRQRDDRLLEILKTYGIWHINRVEGKWTETRDITRITIEEIINGRRYQPG